MIALRNLEDEGWLTLRAALGVPRADFGIFPAGVALSGGRMIPRRLQAHSRAIVDLVVLEHHRCEQVKLECEVIHEDLQ